MDYDRIVRMAIISCKQMFIPETRLRGNYLCLKSPDACKSSAVTAGLKWPRWTYHSGTPPSRTTWGEARSPPFSPSILARTGASRQRTICCGTRRLRPFACVTLAVLTRQLDSRISRTLHSTVRYFKKKNYIHRDFKRDSREPVFVSVTGTERFVTTSRLLLQLQLPGGRCRRRRRARLVDGGDAAGSGGRATIPVVVLPRYRNAHSPARTMGL